MLQQQDRFSAQWLPIDYYKQFVCVLCKFFCNFERRNLLLATIQYIFQFSGALYYLSEMFVVKIEFALALSNDKFSFGQETCQ
jgi:hypothetical protein